MTSKIGSILGSDNNFNAEQSGIDTARQILPLSNTNEQNQTSINHLKNRAFGMTDDRIIEKTPLRQIVESLAKNPINENLKGETVKIIVNPKKSPEKMSADDYRQAVWQAVFKQAGYGMLTDGELRQAVSLIKSADSSITSSGLDLENMRRSDKLPGVLTVDTDKYTIELAKRAGEAVLGNAQNEAEKAAAAKNEAQSTTNQMLIDPLKLGGNVPVRWLERILNTPKELLRQIDKGEILPGSSTAKWIGGKIGEYITGKPAPPMKTASEAIEELTGAKLPAIPDVELPRPFEYKTDKYKADGKTGEDVGATAIDILLLKRGIVGKPNATPESLGNLNISKVFRVQGGVMPKASKFRISIGEAGEMVVKDKNKLFVTFDDMNRVKVFNGVNRAGKAEVISFEVKTSFVQQVRKFAVPQEKARQFPDLPQGADATKTNNSFGLPANWIEMLKESSFRGTGKIEKLETSTPAVHKLFPAVTLSNQLERKPE